MTSEQQQRNGPRAAWGYLCLAVHALLDPALAQLPPYSPFMRAYGVYCMALYGGWSAVFLMMLTQPAHPHADPLFASPVAVVLWGGSALLVGLANGAALLIGGWRVWQSCAVATASWAGALEVILLVETLRSHSNTGNVLLLLLWGFFVMVHAGYIQNKLVPIAPTQQHVEDDSPPGPTLSEEEEDALLKRLLNAIATPMPRLAVSAGGV